MKRILLLCGLLLAVQAMVAGAASASYRAQDDIQININLPVNAPNLNTAGTTFKTQELVHGILFKASGASVDHYYIWLNVNGQPVAAVDPAKYVY